MFSIEFNVKILRFNLRSYCSGMLLLGKYDRYCIVTYDTNKKCDELIVRTEKPLNK